MGGTVVQTQKSDDVRDLVEEFQKLTGITDMETLENLRNQLQDEKRIEGRYSSYAQGGHSNPRFYKYYWQVYISPPVDWLQIEGEENFKRFKRNYRVECHDPDGTVEVETEYTGTYEEYLEKQARQSSRRSDQKRKVHSMPEMSHAKFSKTWEWLRKNRITCVISNIQIPRRHPIWDYTAKKWEGIEFAPSFDDDADDLTPDGRK